MLAALRGGGAGAVGRGGGAIAVLRSAGAAVLSAQVRPYSQQAKDDGEVGKDCNGNAEFKLKQECLVADVGEIKRDVKRMMEGSTPHQQAQDEQLGKMEGHLEALVAGTTPYQQTQAETLASLVGWRTSVVAITKFTSFLVVSGGVYVKFFM